MLNLNIQITGFLPPEVLPNEQIYWQPHLVGGGVEVWGCGGYGGEVIYHKKVQQSFLKQSLNPTPPPPPHPIKNSRIRPCYALHLSPQFQTLNNSYLVMSLRVIKQKKMH